MTERKPSKFEFTLLRLWHAWAAGSFLIAYLTADEDTYAMHLFAGYSLFVAIAVRLLAGIFAPERSPLRLPRPNMSATWAWITSRKGRNPLFAWLGAALLITIGLSAISGALADSMTWLEDLHEAVAETSLMVVFAHIAFVVVIFGGRRIFARLTSWMSTLRPIKIT